MPEFDSKPLLLNPRPNESDGFYARRAMDPILVALADSETRSDIAEADILAFETAQENGNLHEVVELGTDYTYRSFGVLPHRETAMVANKTLAATNEILKTNDELLPVESLRLEMRKLDLRTVLAAMRHMDTSLNGTSDAKKAVEVMTAASMRDIINDGARLLGRFQQIHDSLNDQKQKSDVRGTMFELLYATFARYQAYEAERYDTEFVLGSTEFEDKAAKHFSERNHNFDTLIVGEKGEVINLVQCKNYQSEQEYEDPIKKITSRSFGKFMNNTHAYVTAIGILASNSADTTESVMRRSLRSLQELFDTNNKEHVAPDAGQIATKHAVRV